MIVPRPRLLLVLGACLVPAGALAGLAPAAAPACAAATCVLLAAALLDAGRALGVLDGVEIELEPVVRLFLGRRSSLKAVVKSASGEALMLRIGLVLPEPLHSDEPDLLVRLPAGTNASRIGFDLIPTRRGAYALTRCPMEAPSPWGLWSQRSEMELKCQVRVYPDLLSERRHVSALFLNRGGLGAHVQRQVGKGREFEKLREYAPGDSFDDIHWKATARRSRPVTRVYQIERTQEVFVAVDASRLSARPASGGPSETPSGTTLERYLSAALVLALAAQRQGDRFGLLTFSDRLHRFVAARNGRVHFQSCLDALYTLMPRAVSPDFEELFATVRLRLRRRALLVFLTSLDDPVLSESFLRGVELVRRQHLILVAVVRPQGARPLFSRGAAATREVHSALAGHMRWQALSALEGELRQRGVRLAVLENEGLSGQLVSEYMAVKRRQLL